MPQAWLTCHQNLCLPLLYASVGLPCTRDEMSYEIAELAASRLRGWYRALDERPDLSFLVKTAWVFEPSSLSQRVLGFRNLQHLTLSTRELFWPPDITPAESERPRLLSIDCFDELNGFDDGSPIASPSESFDLSGLRSLAIETMLNDGPPWRWVCALTAGLRSLQLDLWGSVQEAELACLIQRHGQSLRHLRLSTGMVWATNGNAATQLPSLDVACPGLVSFGMDIHETDLTTGNEREATQGYSGRLFSRLLSDGHPTLRALELGAGRDIDQATNEPIIKLALTQVLRTVCPLAGPDGGGITRLTQLRRVTLSQISLQTDRGADDEVKALLGLGIEVIDRIGGSAADGLAAPGAKDDRRVL
jgi:hypothetical protein